MAVSPGSKRALITRELKRLKHTKTSLATALGLSNTSADRYLKWLDEGELDDGQKRALANALAQLGIDPSHYMEMPNDDDKTAFSESLIPLLDAFGDDPDVLDAVVRILGADARNREMLRILAVDRLRRLKK
jgi:hypothetical protein